MKTSRYHPPQFLVLIATLWLALGCTVEATVLLSNLDDLWTSGGIGDIHSLFPGGNPYGTDTARFTTGTGSRFVLNAVTLEFYPANSSQQWANISVQLFQQTGNVLLGSLRDPSVNSKPTQWPGSTTFVDFTPAAPITLDPSSQYAVVLSVPADSPSGANLLFAASSAYSTPTDWKMGLTTSGNPYASWEHLMLAVDVTPIPEPCTAALLLGGCAALIRRRTNQRPGVDAGWRVLFAFQRPRPRATQAER
jgi:hypothetical protein